MNRRTWLLLVPIVGLPWLECCGSSEEAPGAGTVCGAACEDASVSSDAGGDSAAPQDDGAAPLVTYRFVIDRKSLPVTSSEARAFGLDLDGDQVVDNTFGQFLAAFAAQGFEVQASADRAVDRGDSLTLVETKLASATGGSGSLALFAGATPSPAPCANVGDVTCRKHFAGGGTFTIAANSARDTPLPGLFADGGFAAGPGELHVAIPLFAATPLTVELVGARVSVPTVTTDALGPGIIAGAVRESELRDNVIPAIHRSQAALVARDCTNLGAPPACGCAAQSEGRMALDLFDATPKNARSRSPRSKAARSSKASSRQTSPSTGHQPSRSACGSPRFGRPSRRNAPLTAVRDVTLRSPDRMGPPRPSNPR